MLFNSVNFCLFFIIVFILYWVINAAKRWLFLLVVSYFFYFSWEPIYLLLIIFSTLIDYSLCLHLTSSDIKRKKQLGLTLSIVANLALLFSFKYYDFFKSIVEGYSFSFHAVNSSKETSLLLPVGISFYTFQTLSYSIDVYRDKYLPERHLGKFALFVSFFPQLIAGPIERANKLLPQFNAKNLKFKLDDLRNGLLLFVWGLFKKIVIADNLRVLVDHVFNNQEFQSGGEIIFALFAFSFQIYADFSGYSDMAIGLAKMLGIDLSVNFKTPYFSQSVTQFWRRWHITLSSWLKDYVYVPLKGNRATSILTFRNVMITFILAGLWHGASWGFVIWGTIHGVFVVSERMLGVRYDSSNRIVKLARSTVTFLFVMLAWLPFRAEGLDQLTYLVSQLINFSYSSLYLAFAENIFTPGVFGIVFLLCTDFIFGKSGVLKLNELNWRVCYVWAALICILIFFLGDAQSGEFLYFQF